jgi:hypothetical protein
MSVIKDFGYTTNPIWVLLDAPYDNDALDGVVLSGGYGYNFKKIWKLGGLDINRDTYIRSLRPCLGATYDTANIHSQLLAELDRYRPTFIVPLSDGILNYLVPETTQAKKKNSSLMKWAGSLLKSKYLSYPHYIIGSHPPDWVTRNWTYNEIQAFIDFGHVKEEFDFWKRNDFVQPPTRRNLLVKPKYADLICYLYECLRLQLVSVDIETIRPGINNSYYGINCGYPYIIALAKSATEAMSFSLWDYDENQCCQIWRLLNEILTKVPQIGQNYYLFDSHYLEALGFSLCLKRCVDTLIRHHVLWPSLKHALHFQTRQYTREPYYKDEGKNFNVRFKDKFMIYNAKDAAVTYEIYERQEEEFNERPWLR